MKGKTIAAITPRILVTLLDSPGDNKDEYLVRLDLDPDGTFTLPMYLNVQETRELSAALADASAVWID
jgi:hypothetical protein